MQKCKHCPRSTWVSPWVVWEKSGLSCGFSFRTKVPDKFYHSDCLVEEPMGIQCFSELVEDEVDVGARFGDPGHAKIEQDLVRVIVPLREDGAEKFGCH